DFRAWFEMVCYCARNLTDGFLPASIAERLWRKSLDPLLLTGMLMLGDGGYMVHDYLDWNDSKQTVEQRRERARRGGAGKAASTATSRAQARAVALPSTVKPASEVQVQELPPEAPEDDEQQAWMIKPYGWTDQEVALVRKLRNLNPKW